MRDILESAPVRPLHPPQWYCYRGRTEDGQSAAATALCRSPTSAPSESNGGRILLAIDPKAGAPVLRSRPTAEGGSSRTQHADARQSILRTEPQTDACESRQQSARGLADHKRH